jgi:retron-type reverse transcriptase
MIENRSLKEKKKRLKIRTKNKSYNINDSSLYNLSPQRLEKELKLSRAELEELCADENYRVFMQETREIQCPKYELNKVHTRLASLLCRIQMPDYLHSGVKKRSYVSNAMTHLGNVPVLTMDISKFFPSVTKSSIFNAFTGHFKIDRDVAGLLSELCTVDSHLPTGSRISLPLAYWCSKKMYEKLERYCQNKNIRMTVYVDDITFSGEAVNKLVEKHVASIIREAGYKVNEKKTRLYSSDKPKLITGVIINGDKVKVRNKHQLRIHELLQEMPEPESDEHLKAMQKELLGRLDAAGQLEERFSSMARVLRVKINKPTS